MHLSILYVIEYIIQINNVLSLFIIYLYFYYESTATFNSAILLIGNSNAFVLMTCPLSYTQYSIIYDSRYYRHPYPLEIHFDSFSRIYRI